MLLKITDGQALDERKLMDVYAESNLENTDFFCPEEPDKEAAVRMVESGFLDFLKNEFFKEPEAICWVLEVDGVWADYASQYADGQSWIDLATSFNK